MEDLEPVSQKSQRTARSYRSTRWLFVAASVLLGVLLGAVYLLRSSTRPPSDDVPERRYAATDDLTDPDVTNPGYVGPDACVGCHADKASTTRSKHFQACREPRVKEMPAGFRTGSGTVTTRLPGFRFEMEQRGSEFFQVAVQSTSQGEERTEARIGLVYGSAPADEVYHLWRGDRLYESKVAWLHPLAQWGYGTLNPHASGDRSRETTTRCVECHNTWLGHVPGTTNQYLEPGRILGVTCENCHGPGRDHVAHHRAHPGSNTAFGITHPGKLNRKRSIDVCTQCHSNAARPRTPAFTFRPGKPVESFFRTAVSRNPEDDHVANQIEYLRQSKCFQKSEMTCTTCHNPHEPNDHAALERSCQTCHAADGCKDHPNQPAAVRSKCVSCHTPPRVWQNVHFHTVDDDYWPVVKRYDHRIAIHPEARDAVLWEWFRAQPDAASRERAESLKYKLTRYWLGEAVRREQAFRFLAAVGAYREALRFDPSPAMQDRVRVAAGRQAKLDTGWANALALIEARQSVDAVHQLQEILAVKPDHAGAHGKLGRLLAEAGRRSEAEKHLRAVADCDPNDAYGVNLLGWLAFLDGRSTEAVGFYRQALEQEPYSTEISTRLGLALLQLERWSEAESAFRTATAVDPNNAGAYQGVAHSLRMLDQPAEALRHARRAAKLTDHKNLDILLTLADAYEDAGQILDARATAEEAIALARATSSPQVERSVRTRFEKYRVRPK